ncbi:HD domain-containing protein [Rhabdothermincola salaria]|uniref:HD domain-containing protein n=1 Tax=Rhabdothermincola salaria TaxID=2903142 RepID=UPI001E341CAE|nr:HD domain-containing protein [Rhabdothermincola salaria]MCD9625276.1 HD domain-containing protein [Rhabdothermincola salaria]
MTQRYTRAFDQARVLHADDVRKGTQLPYLSHVMAVAALVLEYGGDEEQAIAGLLHDAAEDKGGWMRLDAIEAEFGCGVARIVEAVSDSFTDDKATKRDWVTRKTEYIEHAKSLDARAALVSAADKLHNLNAIRSDHRTLGPELWKRFNQAAKRDGTLWYYRSLVDALGPTLEAEGGRSEAMARDLRAAVVGLLAEVVAQPEESVTREKLEKAIEKPPFTN